MLKNKVSFNGVKSDYINFPTGVPQGSPLSPLLFNIYLSDLKDIIKKDISQFASWGIFRWVFFRWGIFRIPNKLGKIINKKLGKLSEYMQKKT